MTSTIKNEIAKQIANEDSMKWNFLATGTKFFNAPTTKSYIENRVCHIAIFDYDTEATIKDIDEITETIKAELIAA